MNQYEIPKEIKTKPKLLGLDIKEMAFVIVLIILIMTFFKDMVHGWFVVPYFIVSIGFLFYMIAPSSNNPQKKNYHSVLLFFKRDKKVYHALDIHQAENDEVMLFVEKENNDIVRKPQTTVEKNITLFSEVGEVDASEEVNNEHNILYSEAVEENRDFENHGSVSLPPKKEELEESFSLVEENQSMLEAKDKKIGSPIAFKENRTPEEKIPTIDTYEESKVKKKGGRFMKRKSLRYLVIAAVLVAILGVGTISGYYFQKQAPISANGGVEDEVLVQAIRSASLKKYEKAADFFNEVDYETLSDDDKDVMLLSYLFADQPEKALELEPSFDEAIVSYYKTNLSMEKIRVLAETSQSKVFAFEVAVADNDYWKIIELKELVKMKGDRGSSVVEAYLELGNVEGAKRFAEELQDTSLIQRVEQIQMEIEKEEEVEVEQDVPQDEDKEHKKNEKKKGNGLT